MKNNKLLPDESSIKDSYIVLARKYRPETFPDLVGQKATVRILTNAISSDRVAHAFMLTGVRGTGKTTTARIIARALNCIGLDGKGKATANPCGECQNCRSISEDRHVDVIEMDAASRTGVDDIRELLEGVRYKPVLARNKIYIIDEVHMLSTQAFNALLKTLEEPPPNIKFIFATTEITKVPVTILSRCQRFDLKRISFEEILGHLRKVSDNEKLIIEDEALKIIARASDGSVRDALSLLDQSIPTTKSRDETITYENVRKMMGISDRGLVLDMYEYILVADISNIFILLREMYDSGSDPIKILQELLEITHWLTCKKIVSSETIELPFSSSDEERATSISNSLSIPKLTMLWQFFLKGLNETKIAPIPIQSLEMVLIRVSYISDNLPPEDIIESLKKKNQLIRHNQKKLDISNCQELDNKNKDEALEGERKKIFKSISDIMSFCLDKKEVKLAGEIKHYLELISFSQGKIEIASSSKIPDDFSSRLNSFLLNETGERWTVTSLNQEGENSLYIQEINLISSDPSVELILNTFPGSKVSKIEKVNLSDK